MTKFPAPTSAVQAPGPVRAAPAPSSQALPLTGPDPRWAVSPVAVVAWLVVQCGFLALGLLQVPLAASMPPGSTMLPELMIAGQIGFAAMLAPLLSRSPATLVVVVAACWPGLLLAGGLAATPVSATVLSGLVVTAWIVALFVWIAAFESVAIRQTVTAVAILLAIGVPLLLYLVTEFGSPDLSSLPYASAFAPMPLAWNCVAGTANWAEALPMGLVVLLGMAIWLARGRQHRSCWR
ncbi:hypothetical protein [Humisphaera borealis]|uniref:Uncharacterized protein n=1 Tax=Humisphaera borealis TaxID=2807512 RepID=A0A7M2WUP1_9BACT|nr:hypothetical protein [Humisphaera borealis]QOV89004.1 hypothetical protein IPV69_22695 [Humisphaera borealis]